MMDKLAVLAFLSYALTVLAGGLMAVAARSLVRALAGLILTLFGVAGLYLLISSPFLAFMQILIYVGAVGVIIFFAIMLTRPPAGAEEGEARPARQVVLAAVSGLAPAALLGWACWKYRVAAERVPADVGMGKLGEVLLGPYVLAFELISVVLFVAMAGAVLLGFERKRAQ
ncbi:MAG: NADH-quinone oxidoreductase subunit J [bacterium]